MPTIHDRLTTRPSKQLTAPHLRRTIWSMLLLVWLPFLAFPSWAVVMGTASALEDPLNVPPVLLFVTMAISTLAGATALSIRIDRELSAAPDRPLPRPWSMSISHMLGAWTAGMAAFIVAQQGALSVWATLGMVLTGSFLNAKFLEWLTERYFPNRTGGGSRSDIEAQP